MAHFPSQLNSTVPASAPQANTIGSALTQLQPLAAVQDLPQHQARNLLQEAWIWRNFGTIRALLEAKLVDPNSLIFDFEAPEEYFLPILAHACRRGDTELVRCLLDHGARSDFWMLAMAFDAGHDDVVRLMAKHVDIDTLEGGISLLHTACIRLDQSAVERLIGLGANVKKQTDRGVAPLVLVLSLGAGADSDRQVAIMTKLLDAGADIETGFKDLTPLALACRDNRIRALSLLLERGADPNADLGRGVLPLSMCCDPGVTSEIFIKLVEGGGRIPLSDALWLIGNGPDVESARKRVCIIAAWNGPHHSRPVAKRYFLS